MHIYTYIFLSPIEVSGTNEGNRQIVNKNILLLTRSTPTELPCAIMSAIVHAKHHLFPTTIKQLGDFAL